MPFRLTYRLATMLIISAAYIKKTTRSQSTDSSSTHIQTGYSGSTTDAPTQDPTGSTTDAPNKDPSGSSTDASTKDPSGSSTDASTKDPSGSTTDASTQDPSGSTTDASTKDPSGSTTDASTKDPSGSSTDASTKDPSGSTTDAPTKDLSGSTTDAPTKDPFGPTTDTLTSHSNASTALSGTPEPSANKTTIEPKETTSKGGDFTSPPEELSPGAKAGILIVSLAGTAAIASGIGYAVIRCKSSSKVTPENNANKDIEHVEIESISNDTAKLTSPDND
ncbi:uncharacterized protein LOC135157708 [Lytechinus pictus]|uniref:uncharacterized protein LOC135157708 n=1 Tax=Lytechinus pictus TaxID=7653 RepID=UPI0030BA1779